MAAWSWKKFLEPLNNDLNPESSVRIAQGQLRPFDEQLVGRFSADLAAEHDKKKDEQELAKSEAEEALWDLVGWQVDLKELGKRWKEYESTLKVNSDLKHSGSAWTIAMVERYIQRQDIAFVQPESSLACSA